MNDTFPPLNNPPIVEAILDIDCDMPPTFDLTNIKAEAYKVYRNRYPVIRPQNLLEHKISVDHIETKEGLQAYRFVNEDQTQLVQIRLQGFSFNRLQPYTALDDYFQEIETTWKEFVQITQPIQLNSIRLRYINRIDLPFERGAIELNDYFKVVPQLPDEENMQYENFITQSDIRDKLTGHNAKIILSTQQKQNHPLVCLLDITAISRSQVEVNDWGSILVAIESLRQLKNRIFYNTLSDKCLQLYQGENGV